MDASGFFFELLSNFFPLLGSIIVGGVLVIAAVAVIFICMLLLVTGICVLIELVSGGPGR